MRAASGIFAFAASAVEDGSPDYLRRFGAGPSRLHYLEGVTAMNRAAYTW